MSNNRRFYCPACNEEFEYSSEWAGRRCQCSNCEHKFIVPSLDQALPGPEILKQKANQKRKTVVHPQKKSLKFSLGVIFTVIFLAVAIGIFLYMNNGGEVSSRKSILSIDETFPESEKSTSNNSRGGYGKRKTLLQPDKPSGIYSGFNLKGIEPLLNAVKSSRESWRVEANRRIDKYRKADIKIKVIDASSGGAIEDAVVVFKLVKHKFRFGCVINALKFRQNEKLYKKVFLDMGFNSSGFNNALKYRLWRGQQRHKPEEIIEWLHSKDVSVRGHCLIWPGMSKNGSHIPKELLKLVEKCQKSESLLLKKQVRERSFDIIKNWAKKWDVCEWDVINETRGNHLIEDLLGKEIEADWFRIAERYSKNHGIKLYLNENRVISDPGKKKRIITRVGKKKVVTYKYEDKVKSKNIMLYYENIKELLKNNAPINALGFQSRFQKILPPEIIYDRLSIFNEFEFPITATEFEMTSGIGNELDKAIMTEKVMTIYFSHKLVDGIFVWTLFPNSTAKGNEIVDAGGIPNLRGKTWLYLTKNRWNTHRAAATNSSGYAVIRGFKGKYEVKIKAGGKEKTITVNLDKDKEVVVQM
jgi:GH35 family endo-1,4-beta-xylanase